MVTTEVKARNEFYLAALFVESALNDYLSHKLNIEDPMSSEFLGNCDQAIRFDQKIDALLEADQLSIIDQSKVSVFRGIYKEFLRNHEAPSLEESFDSPDANDDFLMILYPQEEFLPREEKLTNAIYQLISEVSELVSNATDTVEVKMNSSKYFFRRNMLRAGKILSLFSFLLVI